MTPPPVIRPPQPLSPPPDPRIRLWIMGGVYTLIGLWLAVFDDSLVPLSHDLGILPLTLGAAVGVAVLRERNKWVGLVASLLVFVWLVFHTFDFTMLRNRTSLAPFFLFAGLEDLARAILKTVKE